MKAPLQMIALKITIVGGGLGCVPITDPLKIILKKVRQMILSKCVSGQKVQEWVLCKMNAATEHQSVISGYRKLLPMQVFILDVYFKMKYIRELIFLCFEKGKVTFWNVYSKWNYTYMLVEGFVAT